MPKIDSLPQKFAMAKTTIATARSTMALSVNAKTKNLALVSRLVDRANSSASAIVGGHAKVHLFLLLRFVMAKTTTATGKSTKISLSRVQLPVAQEFSDAKKAFGRPVLVHSPRPRFATVSTMIVTAKSMSERLVLKALLVWMGSVVPLVAKVNVRVIRLATKGSVCPKRPVSK